MSKNKYCDRDFNLLEKLKQENKQLKQNIKALRRQLQRNSFYEYENVKNLLDNKYQEEETVNKKDLLKSLQDQWICYNCNSGVLEIIIYSKINDTYYIRKCNNCNYRTQGKKYDENKVKGIKAKE